MTINEFLADYGSTTQHFKSWSNDYFLEVLDQGVIGDSFQRLVVIYLDKIPVMLGYSKCKLDNFIFTDILKNAGLIPIGVRLFAPESGISRVEADIGLIDFNDIENSKIKNYLFEAKYTQKIHYRSSSFVVLNQSMKLIEYVLPGLIEILAKKS